MSDPTGVAAQVAGPTAAPTGRLMTILVSLYAVAFLDRSILAIVAPALQADLRISATELSLLQGLGFVLFYTVLGFPIGALVDRVSRRAIIFAGVICWSVSASFGGLATGFGSLLLSRFGVGAGEAALSPGAYSIIADSVPRHRLGLMSSIFATGSAIGAALSVGLGGVIMGWATARGETILPLIGVVQPWQLVLLLIGVPGLLLAPAIFLVAEPRRQDRVGDDKVGLRHLIAFVAERRAFFLCCFGGFALWQALSYSYALWVPMRYVKVFGWSYGGLGIVMGVSTLVAVPGGFLIGRASDHLLGKGVVGAPLIVAAVCSLMTGAAVVLAFLAGSGALFAGILLFAYFPSVLIGLGSTAVQMIAPNEYRGRLIALYTFAIALTGAGLGPLMPALLADHVFHDEGAIAQSVIIVAAVTAPLSACLMLLAIRPMERAYRAASTWRTAPE